MTAQSQNLFFSSGEEDTGSSVTTVRQTETETRAEEHTFILFSKTSPSLFATIDFPLESLAAQRATLFLFLLKRVLRFLLRKNPNVAFLDTKLIL